MGGFDHKCSLAHDTKQQHISSRYTACTETDIPTEKLSNIKQETTNTSITFLDQYQKSVGHNYGKSYSS